MHTYTFSMEIEPASGVTIAADVEVELSGEFVPETAVDPASHPTVDRVHVYVEGEPINGVLQSTFADKARELAQKEFYANHTEACFVDMLHGR